MWPVCFYCTSRISSKKSRAKMALSSTEVDAVQVKTASWAYRITRAFLTAFGKLLTYMLNSKGPKMLPCGTPCVMARQSDNSPFINTLWRLSARNDRNQRSDLEDKPRDSNFPKRFLWLRESNAFEISTNHRPVIVKKSFPSWKNLRALHVATRARPTNLNCYIHFSVKIFLPTD